MLQTLISMSATVFSLWMLIDAAQKRVAPYWYLIILTPLGEWVYFFVVKIHDFDLRRLKKMWSPPPSLKSLKEDFAETPSQANRIRFAKGLYDAGRFDEAAALFEEVLHQDRTDREALFGTGLCRIAQRDFETAEVVLKKLIDQDPTFEDYEPTLEMASAQWEQGKSEESLATLRDLADRIPRIKHKVVFGRFLMRAEQFEDAQIVLEEAVEDFQQATRFIKRTNGRWVSIARQGLKEIPYLRKRAQRH